jgi:hypothetical protein
MFQPEVVEKINTHILGLIAFFFPPENCAVYEIMWSNIVEPGRPQVTIWRIGCWIPKATNTLPEHVIIIAFPPQQWLHERASIFRYAYIACLVVF